MAISIANIYDVDNSGLVLIPSLEFSFDTIL